MIAAVAIGKWAKAATVCASPLYYPNLGSPRRRRAKVPRLLRHPHPHLRTAGEEAQATAPFRARIHAGQDQVHGGGVRKQAEQASLQHLGLGRGGHEYEWSW